MLAMGECFGLNSATYTTAPLTFYLNSYKKKNSSSVGLSRRMFNT